MIEWVIRALGVFWIVGGGVTLRELWRSRGLDAMLAALRGGWETRDRIRSGLLGCGAVLTLTGGIALAALDRAAPALMLVNAVVQAAWLVYAGRAFPPEDDEDAKGRRRVTNAFFVWCLATVAVVAASTTGTIVFAAMPLLEAGTAVAAIALLVVQARDVIARSPTTMDGEAEDDTPVAPRIDPTTPRRWMFAPNLYTAPMRDPETDQTFEPAALNLPADLVERLRDFEVELQEYLSPSRDDPDVYVLPSDVRRTLEVRIAELVTELKPHALEGDATWWLPPGEDPD